MTDATPAPPQARNPRRQLRRLVHPLLRIPTPVIFLISALLAVVLLWVQGSARHLLDVLKDGDWRYLLFASPIYLLGLALLCYRWHLLVRMAQGHSNLPRASEAFLTSVVINYAAPIGLAVPSRAALTKRALGLDARATGAIAIWEVVMDVIVLGCGSLIWLGLADGSSEVISHELSESLRAYIFVGVLGAVIVGLALWWFLKTADRRSRLFESSRRILLLPAQRPQIAMLALGTSVVYWILQGVVLAILLTAFQSEISFELILGIATVPILVGMLSPIPGGAVVREALMFAIARLAGLPGGPVIAAGIVYRLALFVAVPVLYIGVRWWIAQTDRHTRAEIQ